MWVNGMMSINLQNSLAVQDVLNNENCQPVNRIEKGDFLEGEEEAIYIPEKKTRRLVIDEQMLALGQQMFQLELQRHQVYLAKYGVTFNVTDQKQGNIFEC